MSESEFQIGTELRPNRYPTVQNIMNGCSYSKPQIDGSIQDKSFSSKYLVEDNRIVYEKYDRHGKLISKIPWIKRPLDSFA